MKSLLLTLPILAAGAGHAATISVVGTPDVAGTTAIVLPSEAGTDWAVWGQTGNPNNGLPSNTSSAGTQTFQVTTVGGGNPRGSGATGNTPFTYSNGESPISATGVQLGGILSTGGVGPANMNTGVSTTLTGITGPVRIQLFTYIFEATGTLNVYLDGSTSAAYTNAIPIPASGGKPGYLYTFDYVPDSAASSVRFEHIKTASSGTNSNVGFLAMTIVPIPEASSISLVAATAGYGLLRRRRRE